MTHHYQVSKFLSILFSKYRSSSKGWESLSNEFIATAYSLVDEYRVFMEKANKTINQNELFLRRSEIAEKELKAVNVLRKEYEGSASRFNTLEEFFENKYESKFNSFDSYVADKDNKNEFLAEYLAYANVEFSYDNLRRFGETLEEYRELCLKYKPQTQPSQPNNG